MMLSAIPLTQQPDGAQPPNGRAYPAIKILGKFPLHALDDLGNAHADDHRADGANQYLPERNTHQLRAQCLFALPRNLQCRPGTATPIGQQADI